MIAIILISVEAYHFKIGSVYHITSNNKPRAHSCLEEGRGLVPIGPPYISLGLVVPT